MFSEPGAPGCGIVPVVADHDLRAGAVVGEEQDQRIVEGAHGAKLPEHAADLAVHAINHRGVDRHFDRLELALLVGQVAPGDGTVHFARPELLQRIGEMIRRADFALDFGQFA